MTFHATCRIPKCGVIIKPEVVLCNRHWKRVPIHLRNDIWKFSIEYCCQGIDPNISILRLLVKAIHAVS